MALGLSALPRLCVLIESYYPVVGGMESQARNLATSLAARGMTQCIVTRRTGPELARRETVDGIPVERVPPAWRRSRGRWLMLVTALPALVRRRRDYEILLVPGFRVLGVLAVVAARLLGKRCVLKAESSGEMSGEFFAGGLRRVGLSRASRPVRVLLGLRNRLLARADALVSMSSDLTAEFRDGGVPAERIHLIPQTVEIARFRPAAPADRPALRKKLGLPEQGLIVVFTGRLVSYKGLPALLDAWKGLAPRHPGATLVLVGAGGVDVYNCEEALRRFVREHGLEDRVIFTGSRTNVEEYLQASDILAFPTENEAFGISLIEGMACGLPSVSTTVGGVKDILAHDVNGLVVEPGNSGQLGAALDRLLRDPDLRARLGRAAARTVRERYTREIVSVQYLELFRRLAAAGGKGNG